MPTPFSKKPARWAQEGETNTRILSHVSASLLAFVFVLSVMQFDLDGLKGMILDSLFRLGPSQPAHPDIVLIAYDDASSASYNGHRSLVFQELVSTLNILKQDPPRMLILLTPFNERIYTRPELQQVINLLGNFKDALIGFVDDESLGAPVPEVLNNSQVPYLPGFISRDTLSFGADSVTRRVMTRINSVPTVFAEAARRVLQAPEIPAFKNEHAYGENGSMQTYIKWQGPSPAYPLLSTQSVEGKISSAPGFFNNKIVILGRAHTKNRDLDFIKSPYNRKPFQTTLLEGAAHSLTTLIDNCGLLKSSHWVNLTVSLAIGILTVNLVLFFSPVQGILFVVAEIISLYLLGWVGLLVFNLWIDLAHPFVVACFGYYLVIPFRLVDEYRKRWHYQNKSELMSELEQLKSNFLSLISHDLKTPIARIHGNAELLLGEINRIEDARTRKYLLNIIQTTEQLSQHVESILDLTRVESSHVPLSKISKDINATVLEVVQSKQAYAIEQNISLLTQLDPIFSFKFDPRLIQRVLANLVENAIKYSPPATTITLQSREEDGWIRIKVNDQGIGIAPEDQQRIFDKFYRCPDERLQNVKGTGLGLYLAKYFVELHQGMIELKSELGKGSCFTVTLPVNAN